MTRYILCKSLVPWLCSRSQPGIKVIIRDLQGHLLHTVTFLVLCNFSLFVVFFSHIFSDKTSTLDCMESKRWELYNNNTMYDWYLGLFFNRAYAAEKIEFICNWIPGKSNHDSFAVYP